MFRYKNHREALIAMLQFSAKEFEEKENEIHVPGVDPFDPSKRLVFFFEWTGFLSNFYMVEES